MKSILVIAFSTILWLNARAEDKPNVFVTFVHGMGSDAQQQRWFVRKA
ncbi:MAG: hypothetical protein O3B01_00610 [Planctomycetota bacterium]|nr:hypothetical protein [Planctomycetota bacterium]MDA1137055.1 hypothetical protein [Planctomycetota bacterium]